jgi:prolyl-tRNA editing enzyme YbaK/EbsC (Cys-tRNA(Pro) deacylase)
MAETEMKDPLSRKAKKVQDHIRNKGFEFVVKELPDSTRTAKDAAKALGCTAAQIAKSLVFKDKALDAPILVIASGINRVGLEKIKQATGRTLVQADGKFVKDRVGFAIGGVPPVGHDERLVTLLDPDLKQYDRIWAAAGTPNAVFELRPADLEPLTDGVWIDLKENELIL